jgi:hypothetical protein
MDYYSGQIIKYKEDYGYKRTLYGIICEQLNQTCIRVITELKNEPILDLFLDPVLSNGSITIEEIIASYKQIPLITENNIFSSQRNYLREIAKLLEKTK